MLWVILFLIFTVFIRWYLPVRGFLCDDVIAYITRFGNDRKVVIDDRPIVIKAGDVKYEEPKPVKKAKPVEGVSLNDVKAKEHGEVDTSYLYGNFDDSEEDLTSVVKKGINRK